jgi:hypothetical protein
MGKIEKNWSTLVIHILRISNGDFRTSTAAAMGALGLSNAPGRVLPGLGVK